MKNFLISLLTFSFLLISCKDKSFQISGKLNNPQTGNLLYLKEINATEIRTLDSIKLSDDGLFSFKREIDIPAFFLLTASNQNYLTFLAQPGEKIKISADYLKLANPESISGSEETKKMLDYNTALKNTIDKLVGLRDIYVQNADSPELPDIINTIDSTAQSYLAELNEYTKKYIDDNINSLISLMALYQQVGSNVNVMNPTEDLGYFVKVDSSLFKRYPESDLVKSLHEQVQAMIERINYEKKDVTITGSGSVVPEISLPAPNGEIIKLSSTRGNIVLLDFWASWCAPCRRESPNLVKAFNMYKNRGFQIYQVALDKTREDWLRGIEQDKLDQWIHVSDLKYWNSVVVPLYKIEAIPYNLLLDKEGKVIASNLRGEQLLVKLNEIFR
jgi:thiol-disulfide isomerase/thioredoxin